MSGVGAMHSDWGGLLTTPGEAWRKRRRRRRGDVFGGMQGLSGVEIVTCPQWGLL